MITKLGTSYLNLKCDVKVLTDIVKQYIEGQDSSFSFINLRHHIIYVANKDNLFKKAPNTEYSDIDITNEVVKQINFILWEEIWNKRIIIDFSRRANSSYIEDFYFIKMKSGNVR